MSEGSESDNEENQLPEGTFAIHLSKETQERFEVVADWHLSQLEPQKEIPLEVLQAEVAERKESTDFFAFADEIKNCRLLAPLLIYDPSEQYGEKYLLCLSGEAKYGYLQNEEDANMALVDDESPYEYKPPEPTAWKSLKSDELIEKDWVTDSRPKIRLQVKRSKPRGEGSACRFVDRNVDDVIDGYVACESYKDSHVWEHVDDMERAMQAVPILVEGGSQTELKHPKNVYTQYEPRVFTEDEVATIWESPEMKKFMVKAEGIMNEVAAAPDIMGEFRNDIEQFYQRDHVEVVEETELVEHLFFTDLNFSHDTRVSQVRWHPTIEGIVAMAVVENTVYEEYLNNLTKRLVMPSMVMIWSMSHPLFPQVLLRVPDDITIIEWHPSEEDILIGGCMNGQVVIWDIGDYTENFVTKTCVWDHSVVLTKPTGNLHIEDGFIPILYWSAESNIAKSHKGPIEDLKWLPKNVWFSNESAFPKVNQDEENRQFITCASSMYILVWDFLKHDPDGGTDGGPGEVPREEEVVAPPPTKRLGKHQWAMLKAKSTIAPLTKGSKWTPAIGKYSYLNKIWAPVHKIQFLDPTPQPLVNMGAGGMRASDDVPFLKVLITSLSVTDRPDLMIFRGKGGSSTTSQYNRTMGSDADSGSESGKPTTTGRESVSSTDMGQTDDDLPIPDPTNMALPTMLMAGTIIGTIFRADLSKNKVDVETNNLLCTIDWVTPVHDGPVKVMTKSPFMNHLLLSMGGYSFAVWNEGIMNKPVVMHYVDGEQFTAVAWSLEQPNIVFFSGERGNLAVWDITKRRSEPVQVQNISGRAINAVAPYKTKTTNGNIGHFVSVGDESGTLRIMTLPKHLWEYNNHVKDTLQSFVDTEISKKQAKESLKSASEKRSKLRKKGIDEELEEDTKVEEPEDEYLLFFFQREHRVMQSLYGFEWKDYLKHADLPREDYVVAASRKSSSAAGLSAGQSISTSRRQDIVSLMSSKSAGVSVFLKASDKSSS